MNRTDRRVAAGLRSHAGRSRILCYLETCRATAHYQAPATDRYYCSDHAADVAAIVVLREIDAAAVGARRRLQAVPA